MNIKLTGLAVAVFTFLGITGVSHAQYSFGPIQWTDPGSDGFYYELMEFAPGTASPTWATAALQAESLSLDVDGTLYYGHLAPVLTGDQAGFLQSSIIDPSYDGGGTWGIIWTGNYVNNGIIYGGSSGALADTSWVTWSGFSTLSSPDLTIGQPDNYGIAMSGSGYDWPTAWRLQNPSCTDFGGYLLVFDSTTPPGPVPEPSTVALAALGGMGLLLCRGKRNG